MTTLVDPVLPDHLLRVKARVLAAACPRDVQHVRAVCGYTSDEGAALQLARFDGDLIRCMEAYWSNLEIEAKMQRGSSRDR